MKIVLFLYHGNEDTDWPRLSVHWAVNVVVLLARHPIRTMVLGIPNMGNSTFINSFAGEACTNTGNRPRDLVVCIGPSICKDCSEVVEAFRTVFGRQYWPELFCEKYLHHVQQRFPVFTPQVRGEAGESWGIFVPEPAGEIEK